ncbi:MAG: S8 family serine peptidase [Calditrichota bacterium]
MLRARTVETLTLIALLTCFVAVHSSAAAPFEVQFISGTFVPAAGQYDIPQPISETTGKVHCLVQLNETIHAGQRAALKAAGVELLAYVPDKAYIAAVNPQVEASTLEALGVRYISPMRPEYKLHPRVMEEKFSSWSEYSPYHRIFSIEIMPDISFEDAEAALKQAGCEVGHRFNAIHTVLAAVEPERIGEIAALDAVLFIDEMPPPLDEINDVVRTRLHVNEIQAAPYNLTGDSVTILVYDGGLVDGTHPDFGNRVTTSETGTISDHSTHVAGTVGGSGASSSGTYKGMAPAATIISGFYNECIPNCLYESPNDFEPDYTAARTNYGIELTTNSIGANIDPNGYPCEWFGDYETTSRLLDQLTLDTEGSPLIMFFAAGNERNGTTCGFSTYRCMSVPAGAKNIITIGATSGSDVVASFSSWGPTDDGRLKPEVCATGVDVTSCRPGPQYGYQSMSGTSMATPASSGTGCLILNQWHRMFPNAPDPLPETMKALLINSATDVSPDGPDFRYGFGIVNGLAAIQQLTGGGVLESALEIDETFERTFTVASGLSQLHVSIAWSDIPAIGNVAMTLVNDLDLRLIDPNGTTHDPWRLRHDNPAVPVGRGNDSVNVCEKVTVNSPVAGTWTLRVTGRLNGSETQNFALAANVMLVNGWASIAGQIRSETSGQGIPGRVHIMGSAQTANTDAQGNYTLFVPANAAYTIQAISYGFVPRDSLLTATGTMTINLSLRTAQNGTLTGTVFNQFNAPLAGSVVNFDFPRATIPSVNVNAGGVYTTALPGANFYDVTANYFGAETSSHVFVPENGTATANFVIEDARFGPAGPDTYGYYAYEATDPGLSAVYDWLEISPELGGSGTVIHGTPGNDWHVTVNLPFNVQFYGSQYSQIDVSADGWVHLGGSVIGDTLYRNLGIPDTRVPNGMVCVFWDDLYPYHATAGGDISYYHDAANGRFIIEYNDVPQYRPTDSTVTAQVIFYNLQTRPTLTGDNEIQLQYRELNYQGPGSTEDADATVGIESPDGTDGLQIVYDGTYDANCFALGAQYALRFTTGAVAGYASVHGQLSTVPPIADVSGATITIGQTAFHPNLNGSFARDSIFAGIYDVSVTYSDFETEIIENVNFPADANVEVNFNIYRLDPARNLAGAYDQVNHDILLTWDRPLWQVENTLDDFSGYQVMLRNAGIVASVTDTFYVFHVTESLLYDLWVEALYSGGTADSSNHYRIAIDLSAEQAVTTIPEHFYLGQNYPNPFNPTTRIEYGLPETAMVTLAVYDVLGRHVAVLHNGIQPAGVYRVNFDGNRLGTGIYFARLHAGTFSSIQKMLLVR